jgi:2-octaprenyl-6-methoxyphenol hydroxylase
MLQPLALKVALIEAVPFNRTAHPSFDERTTALSNGSRRVFEALNVWPSIQRGATAIKRIHISDQGRFGFARLSAEEQGLAALGHVVPNWQMGATLWQCLQEQHIEVLAPAHVLQLNEPDPYRSVVVAIGEQQRRLQARLIVAADGVQSVVRQAAGISSSEWDYRQTAIICNALTQRFHDHVAYERFTPGGPLAVLPLAEARVGLVWNVDSALAPELLALQDEEFLQKFQREFGFRLGRFIKVGERHSYPLSLTRADAHTAIRLAVIGNAAQSMHPIAGQGLNLGLRDAASLAEVLADALRAGSTDPGAASLLARYSDWRQEDSKRIAGFTDGLVRLFHQPLGVVKLARDVGLLAFDLMPSAKNALSQLSLGASSRVPRLARGAPL